MEILLTHLTNPDQWQWTITDKLFAKLNTSYIIINNTEVTKHKFETL